MVMNNKLVFTAGILLGAVGVYTWRLLQIISLQEKVINLSQRPEKFTRRDWWENNMPDTDDEYTLTLAKRDWLRNLMKKYVYPYVDNNAADELIKEFLVPLNDRLVVLEMQQEARERASELLLRQKMAAGQTDD